MIRRNSSTDITYDEEKSDCDSLNEIIRKAKRQSKQSLEQCHKLINTLILNGINTPFSDYENDSPNEEELNPIPGSNKESNITKSIPTIHLTSHVENTPSTNKSLEQSNNKLKYIEESYSKVRLALVVLCLCILLIAVFTIYQSIAHIKDEYSDIDYMNDMEYYSVGASKYMNYIFEQKTGLETAKKSIFRLTYHK